ncbi:unnamed protein product [Microthlaspi erraticum]|uniref:Arabidopsis retrotransposon Orf1 C-terminal domain-containing protein n=1 Tax=Microthlaspi erraticum TaxID=1685480 RepID=A0A6D2IVE7_9BRAS|nr:unnamed protein product [Microthlaspi erraticum]
MLLPNRDFTTVGEGNNIDFSPPLHTLVGHEDDMREEEPELDRAEDRVEDRIQIEEELGEPDCYYFEEYEAPRMNPSVVAAHKRIGLLQKFNKWQGKAMKKMQNSMDKMVSKIKSLEKKVTGSSSKKNKASLTSPFRRSLSVLTTPRRLPAQDPPRASSYEPREAEETELGRVGGRVKFEEPEFENPGYEFDPAPYQDFHQSSWPPYNRFERARFHQGQGSHTHFEDDDEEPQTNEGCTDIVEWSAPELASQIFGEHLGIKHFSL